MPAVETVFVPFVRLESPVAESDRRDGWEAVDGPAIIVETETPDWSIEVPMLLPPDHTTVTDPFGDVFVITSCEPSSVCCKTFSAAWFIRDATGDLDHLQIEHQMGEDLPRMPVFVGGARCADPYTFVQNMLTCFPDTYDPAWCVLATQAGHAHGFKHARDWFGLGVVHDTRHSDRTWARFDRGRDGSCVWNAVVPLRDVHDETKIAVLVRIDTVAAQGTLLVARQSEL